MRLIAASSSVPASAFNVALTTTGSSSVPSVALPSQTTYAADCMRNGTVYPTPEGSGNGPGVAFSSLVPGSPGRITRSY